MESEHSMKVIMIVSSSNLPLALSQFRVYPSLASCHPFLSCMSHGNTSCNTSGVKSALLHHSHVLRTSVIIVQKHQIRKILEVRFRQVLNYRCPFLLIWFDNFYGIEHGKNLQKSIFNSPLYTCKIDSTQFLHICF